MAMIGNPEKTQNTERNPLQIAFVENLLDEGSTLKTSLLNLDQKQALNMKLILFIIPA